MRVVLVGICGSCKSTLAQGLRPLGYGVKECRQEHSEVPHMWQVLSRPDVLIFLDASEQTVHMRGRRFLVDSIVPDQRRRLRHARQHCDLYVLTDDLTAAQVLGQVAAFLSSYGDSDKVI